MNPSAARARALRPTAAERFGRFTPRTRSRWAAIALLLACLGVGATLLSASVAAHDEAVRTRLAFRAQARGVAGELQLALAHEADLELAADAFLVDRINATEAQFLQWGVTVQAVARYPEIAGVVAVSIVRPAQLAAFNTNTVAQLRPFHLNAPEAVVPAGRRPYYCLTRLLLKGRVTIPEYNYDYCFGTELYATRDSGRLAVSADTLNGTQLVAIASPIFRGGRVPATVAGRRRAFLGWTAMGIDPAVLLDRALRGHPTMALVLKLATINAPLVFTAGTAPRDGESMSIRLNPTASLETLGPPASAAIFAHGDTLALLLGGLTSTLLASILVLSLGTGRERALRLVAEKTRELAAEARRSEEARDTAVEASNAKSVFVATVSHELRTPLSGVIGTIDLLLDRELEPEEREYAEVVRSSGEALLAVINDLLDYSKIEAGKLDLSLAPFCFADLVAECCGLLRPVASSKGLELGIELDPALPPYVAGDSGRLRQVLTNLLSNAVKFTSDGFINVRASSQRDGSGVRLRVEISDTGIGIDEDQLDRLFQPFTQADSSTARRYGGTGLGLTISNQLIEMMGGQMGANSSIGKGSMFWFEITLPTADAPKAAESAPKPEAGGERDEDGKLSETAPLVLVAEDNPVNQMLAVRMLEKCGYRADVVGDGVEVLAAVAHGEYAAVLMDCQMPEMDGYEATREIRRRETPPAHMPIIAVTAHSMSGDRENCIAAGMDDYVSKPLRTRELSGALARALAGGVAGRPGDERARSLH
ncbi:MAG: ATP-binding protein [Solirubrobacteraceae bacterium]|jgi:signal transduction histidine kinase/ActR/RegA family two-component response regulator